MYFACSLHSLLSPFISLLFPLRPSQSPALCHFVLFLSFAPFILFLFALSSPVITTASPFDPFYLSFPFPFLLLSLQWLLLCLQAAALVLQHQAGACLAAVCRSPHGSTSESTASHTCIYRHTNTVVNSDAH